MQFCHHWKIPPLNGSWKETSCRQAVRIGNFYSPNASTFWSHASGPNPNQPEDTVHAWSCSVHGGLQSTLTFRRAYWTSDDPPRLEQHSNHIGKGPDPPRRRRAQRVETLDTWSRMLELSPPDSWHSDSWHSLADCGQWWLPPHHDADRCHVPKQTVPRDVQRDGNTSLLLLEAPPQRASKWPLALHGTQSNGKRSDSQSDDVRNATPSQSAHGL